ncbi:MAG: phosphopantothenoylcysteine decarboxylase [Candidatus Omnitrophica bacterium]|nr:phosphopantothenoylcysteine decarboxylase [Candidatus Omnitrophota bacterium]
MKAKKQKNILLGVTAGVAIYKSCSLVRILRKRGFAVKVVMTPNATKLISSKLFESLTDEKVYAGMFEEISDYSLKHIALSKWADAFIVAPCSANTVAKLAHGICDNLLTSIALALPQNKPVVVAPAMNTNMWKNPVTRKNISQICEIKNYTIVNPQKGVLASFDKGEGVLAPLEDIVKQLKAALGK